MKALLALVVVWVAAVYFYEFRFSKRQMIAAVAHEIASSPAPVFGLVKTTFDCAATSGAVTGLQVSGAAAIVECGTGFTEATTRCASGFPMIGYGDQIKCAAAESVHCAGGPLQTIGLFKDDSFCGDVSDRDLGPPQEAPRADD